MAKKKSTKRLPTRWIEVTSRVQVHGDITDDEIAERLTAVLDDMLAYCRCDDVADAAKRQREIQDHGIHDLSTFSVQRLDE